MITRTENGYRLNDWECCPTRLPNGAKLTPGESRAVICRINGLSHQEAAVEMHVTKASISQYWQTIYYKLHTSSAMVAITKLMELEALKRTALMLALVTACNASFGIQDFERFTRRPSRDSRARSGSFARRAGRITGLDFAGSQLNELLGASAAELYTAADIQSFS